MVKAVFLDRDGVINRSLVREGKPFSPRALSEFELYPGVPEAIRAIADAGFLVFVATNQPDIGNGFVAQEMVDEIHAQLMRDLPIKKVYMCPHSQKAGCDCRKPKPGMLLTGQAEFGLDMSQSFMVGDRYTDMQAALAAGVKPIFLDHKYVETPAFSGILRVSNLLEASKAILGEK